MIVTLRHMLAKLPGPATRDWPEGEPFAEGLKHGTMSVELFAPRILDKQQPHEQDELYFIVSGEAEFVREGRRSSVAAGDAIFVAAGDRHHFESMNDEFVTWVVFWGPKGGEL